MTFSCPNYDFENDSCLMLKKKCVLAQPGCVLEGKVKIARPKPRKKTGKRK